MKSKEGRAWYLFTREVTVAERVTGGQGYRCSQYKLQNATYSVPDSPVMIICPREQMSAIYCIAWSLLSSHLNNPRLVTLKNTTN